MDTSRFLCVLSTVACGVLCAFSAESLSAQTIPQGNIAVDLETFATLPASSGQPARVNVLRAAPDGRIFVNDQRGLRYLVSADGAPATSYLVLASHIPLLQDNGNAASRASCSTRISIIPARPVTASFTRWPASRTPPPQRPSPRRSPGPGNGYTVDPTVRRVKTLITD